MAQCVDLTGEGRFAPNALVRIDSGSQAPADACASVIYRGCWYWIAQDDTASKQVFLLSR